MRIGVIVGSIAKESINKKLASTFPALAPEGTEFTFIDIAGLPMYSYDFDGDSSVVDTYISYLRRKIDHVEPRLIQTIRGIGFTLRVEP